jgi:hypothetical protein
MGVAAMTEAQDLDALGQVVGVLERLRIPYDVQLLQRARRLPVPGVEGRTFSFVSPEDIILLKLRWYREGGETSDRQWEDVLGVLAVQDTALDREYLGRWAEVLGVQDLLDKALKAMP